MLRLVLYLVRAKLGLDLLELLMKIFAEAGG
jgi:hypothetical protein